MRKFFTLTILLFCPSSIWAEVKDVLNQTTEEWTKPSSVFVCKRFNGRKACGSGTAIYCDKEGYLILTCYHVVIPDVEGEVVVRPAAGGEEKHGKVVSSWQPHDMAIIYVQDAKHKVRAAKVAKHVSYAQGLTVCKCGYPGAGPRHVASGTSLGIQTSHNGIQDWYSVHYRLIARGGDSGGGLFRESDHALIGVVWGSDLNNTGFATRVESIWKMIESLKENGWIIEKLILILPPQSVLKCDQ